MPVRKRKEIQTVLRTEELISECRHIGYEMTAAGITRLPDIRRILRKERGGNVVELDQFKTIMNAYEEPLAEMRDSL